MPQLDQFPYFFWSCLFEIILTFLFFSVISLYLEFWFDWIREKVLLNKKQILFFLQITFILFAAATYTELYIKIYGTLNGDQLANLPQVLALLCSFFFLFIMKKGRVKEKNMLLLCLFCSISSSFYIRGASPQLLFVFFLFYLLVIFLFPVNSSDLSLFLLFTFYGYDPALAEWGFELVAQLFFFFLITWIFAKEQPCPKNRFLFFHFLCAGLFLFLSGYFRYNANYFLKTAKLSVLFSGACIFSLCFNFKKKTKTELGFCFLSYLIVSLTFGFLFSPPHQEKLWGIPYGIIIFLSLHLFALFGVLLFWDYLPRRKHALIPLFFGLLFYLLGYLTELAWLARLIEGTNLLLILFSIYALLEEEEETDRDHPRPSKKLDNVIEEPQKSSKTPGKAGNELVEIKKDRGASGSGSQTPDTDRRTPP